MTKEINKKKFDSLFCNNHYWIKINNSYICTYCKIQKPLIKLKISLKGKNI